MSERSAKLLRKSALMRNMTSGPQMNGIKRWWNSLTHFERTISRINIMTAYRAQKAMASDTARHT